MTQEQTPAQKLYGDIAPGLADRSDHVLFGKVWSVPACPSVIAAWRPSPPRWRVTVALDGMPDGYRAMDAREVIKVMLRP